MARNFIPTSFLSFGVIICLCALLATNPTLAFSNEIKKDSVTLRVAVASNFAPVLEKLTPTFEKKTGVKVQLISGASGTFYQQISHGAPFDIFLSADDLRPISLEEKELILDNSRATYALGQLALWSTIRDVSSVKAMEEEVKRFAIANPRIAPYGRAAKEAMIHFDVWQKLSPKLVRGINVGQTFQQVRSKAVDVGIVAQSQLVLNGYSGIVLPQKSHQPIKQQLVVLKSSKYGEQALLFSAYLLSAEIQEQISQFGYYRNVE